MFTSEIEGCIGNSITVPARYVLVDEACFHQLLVILLLASGLYLAL